jgi:hypothetical protein
MSATNTTMGSGLGPILAIFGTFALGAYLARSRAGYLGVVAMTITVFGTALFLMPKGVSSFAAPEEGQAYLAGIEGIPEIPTSFADMAITATSLLVILLLFVGNVLLGVAVWRSGTLPRWAGNALGGHAHFPVPPRPRVRDDDSAQSTPPTVLVGALLIVTSGGWITWSVMRRSTAGTVGVEPQPRVQ